MAQTSQVQTGFRDAVTFGAFLAAAVLPATTSIGATAASIGKTVQQRTQHSGNINSSPWITFGRATSESYSLAKPTDGVVEQGMAEFYNGISQIPWIFDAYDRLDELSAFEEGWCGEGSIPPSREATLDVEALIEKLGIEGLPFRPIIGLDSEGTFSLLIKSDDFVADISIFGDGTYSYFARSGDKRFSSNSTPINGPLPDDLREVLPVFV